MAKKERNPKILMTVTSCSLGKSRSLDKEDGPSNCCTCNMSTLITYVQIFQDDHLWKDSLKYAVAVVVQLMASLLPLLLHLHRGQHTAWGEQSYIFCLFLRRGHQQALWTKWCPFLDNHLLISKVIEGQHLSKNILYVAVNLESF